MSFAPSLKDVLGFRRPWMVNQWAQKAASTAIPNNETIVVMNWASHDLGATVASQHYVGVGPTETGAGERVSVLRQGDTLYLGAYNVAWQQILLDIPDNHPHLWTLICDRDNTLLEAWLDDQLMDSVALTQDPDLTANNQIQLNNSSAGLYSDTHWKGAVFSLTNGSTPTAAQWRDILREIVNPQAALPTALTDAIGTHDAMWYLGEGSNTDTDLENDRNPGTDDLAIQGGLTIADIRTRLQHPRALTQRTFYSLTPTYTATTGAVDFGFVGGTSDEFRVLFDGMAPEDHVGAELTNAAGTHYFRIERVAGVPRIAVRAGGAVVTMDLSEDQFENGGDIAIGAISTTAHVCVNGQRIEQLAMGASMDLSGNCVVNLDGRSRCCLIEGYNTFTSPGDFCAIVCCTVQQPERTLVNLATPLIRFPIQSNLIAAGGATVANQGSGGGTLTLSAIRSTSCTEVRHGYDP